MMYRMCRRFLLELGFEVSFEEKVLLKARRYLPRAVALGVE